MRKASISWSVKQFIKMMNKGTISFDYPIQREGSQWDLLQKSLLIHSLSEDYPVPALYSIVVEEEHDGKKKNVYYILDGKQRLTNIKEFIEEGAFLHDETPDAVIDGERHVLAGKTFEELDEEVQDAILSFSLQIYRMDDITDEQIEDLFFRLNNGTPLSKQQKAKAKMGAEWAEKIQGLVEHELIKYKSAFTPLQIRKADHESTIVQTMMIIDEEYSWRNISANQVFDYSQTLRNNDDKEELIKRIVKAMDYLNIAIDGKERVLLRKVNFPMTLITAMEAMEDDIHPLRFSSWMEEFKAALNDDNNLYPTNYKEFGGAGSVKKDKTLGRIKEMVRHMRDYFTNDNNELKRALEESGI